MTLATASSISSVVPSGLTRNFPLSKVSSFVYCLFILLSFSVICLFSVFRIRSSARSDPISPWACRASNPLLSSSTEFILSTNCFFCSGDIFEAPGTMSSTKAKIARAHSLCAAETSSKACKRETHSPAVLAIRGISLPPAREAHALPGVMPALEGVSTKLDPQAPPALLAESAGRSATFGCVFTGFGLCPEASKGLPVWLLPCCGASGVFLLSIFRSSGLDDPDSDISIGLLEPFG
mmetsp:Transcript_864/g.1695  ORF Transcript_864/g.1695 Transcript_864/m.1695 type:complete len:237 (-) Transcript_864:218-928(-)